ncbi:MAG TPA: MBL fold metallo-hydrolase [Terriglobia bacterium]|nr:MBL fold metallo-hydrolase [Terriglobia bacterium]
MKAPLRLLDGVGARLGNPAILIPCTCEWYSPPGSCERIRNEGELEPQKAQKAQETYVLLVPFVVEGNVIKNLRSVITFVSFLAVLPSAAIGQDARAILRDAAKAMGAEDLKTIQYSGTASIFAFGQSLKPNTPWPRLTVTTYTREIDFESSAASTNAPWAQQLDTWITPYGFLKRALTANDVTLNRRTIDGKKYNVVTYTVEDRYPLNESRENPCGDFWDVTYLVATRGKLRGYINSRNMIEKVETWIDNPVLGDMLIESAYTAYDDFAGLKFPTRIVQKQGGFPVLDLIVSDVKPNAAVHIQPPQQGASAGGSESPVETQRIAEGVFYIKGRQHSVVVEFKDYVAVIEAPVNEAQSLAVIAETRKLIPNKPIRYLINTHHHFDHLGGIRTYVDEGATIVTHRTNKAFYEKILAMPHTLVRDRLSRSRKKANIETVADKRVLTDGRRTAELYLQKGNPHDDGLIFIYLPNEKILIEAEAYTLAMNVIENIERLNLRVEWVLPIHGGDAMKGF